MMREAWGGCILCLTCDRYVADEEINVFKHQLSAIVLVQTSAFSCLIVTTASSGSGCLRLNNERSLLPSVILK